MFIYSSLFELWIQNPPDWVVFTDLIWSSRGFMRNVMAIEFDWIKEDLPRMAKV